MAEELGRRLGKFVFCLLGVPMVLSIMVLVACIVIVAPILVLINPDILEIS
jgi:hypothetical protein